MCTTPNIGGACATHDQLPYKHQRIHSPHTHGWAQTYTPRCNRPETTDLHTDQHRCRSKHTNTCCMDIVPDKPPLNLLTATCAHAVPLSICRVQPMGRTWHASIHAHMYEQPSHNHTLKHNTTTPASLSPGNVKQQQHLSKPLQTLNTTATLSAGPRQSMPGQIAA